MVHFNTEGVLNVFEQIALAGTNDDADVKVLTIATGKLEDTSWTTSIIDSP